MDSEGRQKELVERWTLDHHIIRDVFAKNKHEPFSFINLENGSRSMYNSHQRDSNYSKWSSGKQFQNNRVILVSVKLYILDISCLNLHILYS